MPSKGLTTHKKQILFGIYSIVSLFLGFGLVNTASAQTCGGAGRFESPTLLGYCNVSEIVTKGANWILTITASIIILIIIIGGIRYITSAGDEEKLRASKNMITYALIGLGIILVSLAVVTEVINILT